MHGIWFNPDNPSYAIQCNDGGATITTDGGRTWSTELNQPTEELYMVSVDDQYPYRLYAPQQDNTTVVVPSLPPQTWSFDSPAQMALAENLSFTPWHSLPEHRPLGGINRARKVAYRTISVFRHQRNGVPREEPVGLPES